MNFVAENLEAIRMLATENLLLAGLAFLALYIVATVFSLPGASALTISSGAIFGLFAGGSLSAVAAWTGAVIVFFIVKYTSSKFFEDKIQGSDKIKTIVDKIRANEFKSMLIMRITPVFPFFLVNVVAGVVGVSNRTYFITTACGMVWSFIYAGVGAGAFELLTW